MRCCVARDDDFAGHGTDISGCRDVLKFNFISLYNTLRFLIGDYQFNRGVVYGIAALSNRTARSQRKETLYSYDPLRTRLQHWLCVVTCLATLTLQPMLHLTEMKGQPGLAVTY